MTKKILGQRSVYRINSHNLRLYVQFTNFNPTLIVGFLLHKNSTLRYFARCYVVIYLSIIENERREEYEERKVLEDNIIGFYCNTKRFFF